MGVTVPAASVRVKDIAAVMVTATLPPFVQPGTKIDVTVAAVGDATNLQGGILIMTSLQGVDGRAYAVAQGAVVTSGFIAGGAGNSQVVNHPTVGRVPGGASVEHGVPAVNLTKTLKLQLHQADFTTSARVAEVINKHFPATAPAAAIAHADNSALVVVEVPADYTARPTEFIAEMERLTVEADRAARVIVNERTGTVVFGKEVKISPVAIMHGNLTVEIQTSFDVSQPNALSSGTTQVVPQVTTSVKDEKARNLVLRQGATVEELVRALTSIGSTTRDVIAILQSLRAAGALEAELEVI
jgi:flagellar P-ring protein precursor FlgI